MQDAQIDPQEIPMRVKKFNSRRKKHTKVKLARRIGVGWIEVGWAGPYLSGGILLAVTRFARRKGLRRPRGRRRRLSRRGSLRFLLPAPPPELLGAPHDGAQDLLVVVLAQLLRTAGAGRIHGGRRREEVRYGPLLRRPPFPRRRLLFVVRLRCLDEGKLVLPPPEVLDLHRGQVPGGDGERTELRRRPLPHALRVRPAGQQREEIREDALGQPRRGRRWRADGPDGEDGRHGRNESAP
jgi:hypothetical protein